MCSLLRLWRILWLLAVVAFIGSSTALAQQVRVIKRAEIPNQWGVSYSLKNAPDDFKFDSLQSSEQNANNRVVALRAWSAYTPIEDYEWKLAVILISAERKEDGPVPKPPDSESPGTTSDVAVSAVLQIANGKQESTAVELPVFSRFLADVEASTSNDIQKVSGKRGMGTLGATKVVVEFDGDGMLKFKDPDGKLLSTGTWSQTGAELIVATASYIYIGNVGGTKAKGLRMKNGPRLGSAEEEWSLQLTIAEPIVGTWQLASQKEGKHYGDSEEYYTTKLVFRIDHTVSVDWELSSKRKGWNMRERVTDFDRSVANWEVRDGKIYFTNPKIIRNWRGKDSQWSWFDPRYPLSVESLQTWERVK